MHPSPIKPGGCSCAQGLDASATGRCCASHGPAHFLQNKNHTCAFLPCLAGPAAFLPCTSLPMLDSPSRAGRHLYWTLVEAGALLDATPLLVVRHCCFSKPKCVLLLLQPAASVLDVKAFMGHLHEQDQCYIIINSRSGRPTVSIARPTSSLFPSVRFGRPPSCTARPTTSMLKTVRSGRPPSCIALPTTSVLKTVQCGRPPSCTARPTTSMLKTVWSGHPPSCIALPTTSVLKTVQCGRPPSCIAHPTTSMLKTVRSGRPPSCIALPTTSVLKTVQCGRPPSCTARPTTSMLKTVRSGRPPSSIRSPSLSLPHLLLLYTFQPLTCAPCLPTFDLYDRYRSASLLYKTSKKEIIIYPKHCNTSKTVPGH
ncbi:hypothetical protein LR48_Vigan221s000900 [Vigna angularis]|uniref:Uncharacterized protein n=1 Tax=Phaseolus angularis TaxID=3914 RepID=A0A0L9T640_PHAAN|nr:hypothetical protein LR48_Vigan221s000900 [Vigna angularis]